MLFPRLLFPGLLTSLAFGCSAPAASTGPYPQNPAISDAQGYPRDSTTFYFPAADSLTASRPAGESVEVQASGEPLESCTGELRFASHTLTFFQAPVLSNYYLGAPIYRFTWLRSFHRPVLLTLRLRQGKAVLHTQLLTKSAMPAPTISAIDFTAPQSKEQVRKQQEQLLADVEFQNFLAESKKPPIQVRQEETSLSVSLEQWQHFQVLLARCRFQNLASCEINEVLDGAYWLLEAHQASGYHVVFRHSPDETDGFRKACEYLIELSSVRKEERY
ncbi:hypothetical protein LRS06_20770 [Hymenobacter sp. J193]|uniref:hypothetical protein n=1 Tax=Hymenobacter sp. J193 TaxID=2898429 RepID=UPI0021518016|nr:hypothetical protein [Hymenobacter sp. J193]MCR5890163.1 hypothetical protein [Hymenobacter sp. J193]